MSGNTTQEARKWQSAAGPRQTKLVEEAIKSLTYKGKTYREITDFGSTCYANLFGPVSEAATAALRTVGERFDFNITRANYQDVITAINEATTELKIPEVDKRTTPEEQEKRRIELAEFQQKQAEKSKLHAAKVAEEVAKLKALYPNARPDDPSYNCKQELRAKFPGVKFSVQGKHFAGGNSLDVSWMMGPTGKEVEAIVNKFKYGHFDGMTDSYDNDNSAESEAVRKVLGQMKYVGTSRDYDADAMKTVAEGLAALVGVTLEPRWIDTPAENVTRRNGDRWNNAVYGLLGASSFPPDAIITGVELADEENRTHEWTSYYRVTFTKPTAAAASCSSDEPTQGEGYEVQKHFHTKKQIDFWLVVASVRMDAATFDAKRESAKASGGWYSRKWASTPGGFGFETEEAAKEWAATAFKA